MRADKVAQGHLYADANLLYMFLRPNEQHSAIIRAFMKRVVQSQISLYVSPLTTDELFYRLLLARVKETYSKHPLSVLRAEPIEPIRRLSGELSTIIHRTLSLPNIHLTSIEANDIAQMLENSQQYALMPRDALHLAVMQRLGIQDIVSDDADFDRVAGLRRR